jgi:hypothetical protein
MLDPQDRVVLYEALQPPEGYVLDQGIGTTYSLDLITLLSTPLAFTLFEWEDAKGQPTSNPVLLLEALRRHIDRLTVFCQAGRIAAPAKPNPLFGYLEQSIVEVKAPHAEGVFHPKVWVLRYVHQETPEVWYRFLCLSRNLTDDASWDLSLMLEGPLKDRKVGYADNRPLADFVSALPGMAVREPTDAVKQRAAMIAEEVRRVDFDVPEPFDSWDLFPLGFDKYTKNPLPREWSRGMVVSPFIDAAMAVKLASETAGGVLVSREEELDKLPKKALKGWAKVYVLSSQVDGEPEPGAEPGAADTDRPHGLHAKLFACERGWDVALYVGSANATTAAFERNVEFLVALGAKKSKLGVDQLLAPDDGQASLLSLLQEYEPPDQPVDDRVERTLDDLLNGGRRAMVEAGWELQASPGSGGNWVLRLLRKGTDPLPIPADVTLRAWPVTLPMDTSWRPVEASAVEVAFPEGGTGMLTTFVGCEVVARFEGTQRVARFVLNLPLTGGPVGRREAILRQILDDPQKVIRFLQFLLNDEQVDPMADPSATKDGESPGSHGGEEGFVLLESLLRALARDPKRLDEVDKLLKELGDDEEGRQRIPKGLLDVWSALWEARQGVPA